MPTKDVLNIDAALDRLRVSRERGGKEKNRIALIGVELEGGWTQVPAGINLVHDGSVRGLLLPQPNVTQAPLEPLIINERGRRPNPGERIRTPDPRPDRVQLMTGELPSPPMPPSELGPWMRKYYPHAVNETCGLHVHMSFESALHYARLADQESYQTTILHYVTRWAKTEGLDPKHPLWHRLRGESTYCQHKWWPQHQISQRQKDHDQRRQGHRYTVLNFCHGTNGTLECRLLPMMTEAEAGIRAVQNILDITNAYLATKGNFEKKLKGAVVVQEEILTATSISHLHREERSTEMTI